MQKQKINTIKLGAFISGGLLLVILGIYYIGKKQQMFDSTFTVNAIFLDINGLQIGNNVRFSGINVGVIETIDIISDSTVKVSFSVKDDVRKFIKKDAKAIIGSDGLMGNKIISLIAGTKDEKPILDEAYVRTIESVSMDEIMFNLNLASENAAIITDDLAIITHNISTGQGTIGKLFMDTAFAETIDDAVSNIKQGAGGFKKNMDAASKNILLRGAFKRKKKADKGE